MATPQAASLAASLAALQAAPQDGPMPSSYIQRVIPRPVYYSRRAPGSATFTGNATFPGAATAHAAEGLGAMNMEIDSPKAAPKAATQAVPERQESGVVAMEQAMGQVDERQVKVRKETDLLVLNPFSPTISQQKLGRCSNSHLP